MKKRKKNSKRKRGNKGIDKKKDYEKMAKEKRGVMKDIISLN